MNMPMTNSTGGCQLPSMPMKGGVSLWKGFSGMGIVRSERRFIGIKNMTNGWLH